MRRLSQRTKWALILAIVFAVWGWIDVRARGAVDPADLGLHKTDLTVYTEAGAAFFDGRAPYEVTNPRGWRYLYPPLFAMLLAPLHGLPSQTQVLIWFVASALAAWGCYSECVRMARRVLASWPEGDPFGRIPPWIAWMRRGGGNGAGSQLLAARPGQRSQVVFAAAGRSAAGGKPYGRCAPGWRRRAGAADRAEDDATGACRAGAVSAICRGLRTRATDRLWRAGATWLGTGCGLALALLIVPALLVGWRTNLEQLDTWWTHLAMQVETSTGDELAGDNYSARNQSFPNAVRRAGNWASHVFAGGVDDEGTPELGPAALACSWTARWLTGCCWLGAWRPRCYCCRRLSGRRQSRRAGTNRHPLGCLAPRR